MYNLIIKKEVIFPDSHRHGITISDECKDFITKLLEKDPKKRLGSQNDIEEVLAHPWLESLDA